VDFFAEAFFFVVFFFEPVFLVADFFVAMTLSILSPGVLCIAQNVAFCSKEIKHRSERVIRWQRSKLNQAGYFGLQRSYTPLNKGHAGCAIDSVRQAAIAG